MATAAEEMTDLDAMLALLRRHGVQQFERGPLKIVLFETREAPIVSSPVPAPEEPPCVCGHAPEEHDDLGQCLRCVVGCGSVKGTP